MTAAHQLAPPSYSPCRPRRSPLLRVGGDQSAPSRESAPRKPPATAWVAAGSIAGCSGCRRRLRMRLRQAAPRRPASCASVERQAATAGGWRGWHGPAPLPGLQSGASFLPTPDAPGNSSNGTRLPYPPQGQPGGQEEVRVHDGDAYWPWRGRVIGGAKLQRPARPIRRRDRLHPGLRAELLVIRSDHVGLTISAV